MEVQKPDQNSPQPIPVTITKEPVKVLLTWKSPIRPFKKREREFFTTAGSIIFLVCIILIFIKEFLLVLALIALSFMIYIMSTVEPEEVEHKLTNQGVQTLDKKYNWEQLGRFWFEERLGNQVVMIENLVGIPTRLMLLLGNQEKESIKGILAKYLPEEKPELSQVEKISQWLQEKVPLETNSMPPTSPPQTPKK